MSNDGTQDALSRQRARVAGHVERGEMSVALELLAKAIGDDLTHALVPEYLELAVRSGTAKALELLVTTGRCSWAQLDAARASAIASALAHHGLFQLAWEVTALGPIATDPDAACRRGSWALRSGRPSDAVAAADVAIAGLLHDGLSVTDFIRLSLRKAPSEALLHYERSAVAHIPRLHEPLALRWEALRRSDRTHEAREMRSVCIQHFPERASVWAAAGNQALDEGEPDRADGYFDRCLALDPDWPAALAGKAIVLETRKDWGAAVGFRARIVEVTDALSGKDSASLHRLVRYAAALARVDRWLDAEPLFRRCLGLGAFEKLPAERPVLLRVFSRELYSPAIIAKLYATGVPIDPHNDEGLSLALREATLLGKLYAQLRVADGLAAPERLGLLGICAWLAGDAVHAYEVLDEAELEDAPDLALHYLLASSASAAGAPDRKSIEAFALRAAEGVLDRAARGEVVPDLDRLYARLIAARSGSAEASAAQLPAPAAVRDEAIGERLRRLVAFRAAARAAGGSALEVARASAAALESLVTASADPSASPASSPP